MVRNGLFLCLGLFASGCASVHPGVIAESNSKDLVISVDQNIDLSDKYYLFYEYTIENTSQDWKDVQIIDADFQGQETEILSDENLTAWIEGAELKLKATQYNQAMLLGSIAAFGGVAAITSSNPSVQNAGVATMGAAGAASGVVGAARAQSAANSGIKGVNGTVNVPRSHIFATSRIAPESYIRRWVVLRSPKKLKDSDNSRNGVYNEMKLNSKVRVNGGNLVDYSALVITNPQW